MVFPTHIVAGAGYVEDKNGNMLLVKLPHKGWDTAGGGPTTSDETSEVIWVPKAEVMQYVSTPAMRFRFDKMLNFNGKVCYCSYVTKPEFHVLSDRYV